MTAPPPRRAGHPAARRRRGGVPPPARRVWEDVLEQIRRSHISNYSIFLRDGLLLAYFEYDGDDLAADLAAMAQDERTREWWTLTDPLQEPVASAAEGEWWAPLEEVFHTP